MSVLQQLRQQTSHLKNNICWSVIGWCLMLLPVCDWLQDPEAVWPPEHREADRCLHAATADLHRHGAGSWWVELIRSWRFIYFQLVLYWSVSYGRLSSFVFVCPLAVSVRWRLLVLSQKEEGRVKDEAARSLLCRCCCRHGIPGE